MVGKCKNPKFILYGKSRGIKRRFGTYSSEKEAGTASGLHKIDLENSGYENAVDWSIKEQCISKKRKRKF